MRHKKKGHMPDTTHGERKREPFLRPRKPARRWKIGHFVFGFLVVATCVYVIVAGIHSAGSNQQPKTSKKQPATLVTAAATGEVRIPIAALTHGKAQFYELAGTGADPVRFFALKGSDGVYRVALDACEICYHSGKGYTQNGDEMVCNKCDQTFPSALINQAKRGCRPIGVPNRVVEDDLVIDSGELRNADNRAADKRVL